MIVKLMSSEDADDSDSRKCHELVSEVTRIEFARFPPPAPSVARLWVYGDADEGFIDVEVKGNVYVMNDAGKTISSFGASPLPEE